jgi:hypothetical protein
MLHKLRVVAALLLVHAANTLISGAFAHWTLDPRLNHLAQVVESYRGEEFVPPAEALNGEHGIVICAGGEAYLTQAFISLVILREVQNCTLPIELVYAGDAEMPTTTRRLFEQRFGGPGRNLRCIDALAQHPSDPRLPRLRRAHLNKNGFPIKPYAILTSSFQHVLLLDADNFAAVDPASLFELQVYRDRGHLLWPDLWGETASETSTPNPSLNPDTRLFEALGVASVREVATAVAGDANGGKKTGSGQGGGAGGDAGDASEDDTADESPSDVPMVSSNKMGTGLSHDTESGQLLFNRYLAPGYTTRCTTLHCDTIPLDTRYRGRADIFKAIVMTWILNSEAATVYQFVYGDKDTYALGEQHTMTTTN